MAKPRVFGVLLFDQFTSLDAMGPLAYFNNLPDVEIHIIHDTMSPVTTGGDWPLPAHVAGQRYLPNYTMDNAPPLDVLLVPGGLGVPHHLADRRWEEFIARVYPKLQFLLTVCNGTPFVTRTGLLDHRRATSNKAAFQWVQAQGPNVDWVVEARWVVDGNIWTSSGIEAGIDMAHAFVGSVFGKDVASSIAKKLEYIPNTDSSKDPFAAYHGLVASESVPRPEFPSPPNAGEPCHWGVLAYPGAIMLDIIGVALWPEMIGMTPEVPSTVSFIAPNLDPVQTYSQSTTGGQRIMPTHSWAAPPEKLDILVIPGMATAGPFPDQHDLVAYVKKVYPTVKHVISVGTGSMLLAAAGILNGRKATTSKAFLTSVKEQFSDAGVTWTKGRWVRDRNVWTASGTTAGLDATYALCVDMFGPKMAYDMVMEMEYEPHTNPEDDPFAEE